MHRDMAYYSIAFFITVFLSTAAAVNFVRGPGNVLVPAGATALLKCAVDLNTVQGTVTLYWYKTQNGGRDYITGGSAVYQNSGSERYSLETSSFSEVYSYNLKISETEPGDVGQYQCMGVDGSGSTRSPSGSLSVVPDLTGEPLSCSYYPKSPSVGQTVTFSCTAPSGISPDMLSWWMDGVVRVQPSAHLSNNHGISFVKTMDNVDNFAEFTCLVGTSFDTANNMNCSVTPLAVPIRAEVTPATALGVVAGSATFRCRGTAIPPVTRYRWIYGYGEDTVKIYVSKSRFTVINSGDSSTLTIGGLTMEDNNKGVRCVVLNEITKTIGSAELHVTTHIETTQESLSRLVSSSSVPPTNTTTAIPTEYKKPDQTKTTFGATRERTGTPNGNGDAVNILGCGKDCGEQISPQQGPGSEDGSSNNAVAAALSVLAICALATVVIVYIAYKKRGRSNGRVIKRTQKNKSLKRLRSLRTSISTSNPELVHPDSVRLKTIQVIVNPPPPEWQLRVKDVASEGQEHQEQDSSKIGNDQSPPPVTTSDNTHLEGDALYAKPDKTKKKKHHGQIQYGDDGAHDGQSAASAPTVVNGEHLSVEPDDCVSDGISNASTWDMSSVDSGCEEETDDVKDDVAYAELDLTVKAGNTHTSQTETFDYANIAVAKTTPEL